MGPVSLSHPEVPAPDITDAEEARHTLADLAAPVAGALADHLAQHVLDITEDAEWEVRRAAMEALVRRIRAAWRDALQISERPAGRRRLGAYRTRTPGRSGGPRPYVTTLHSVSPFRGSCGCPDFTRSALGLCKHLWTVLEDLTSGPRKVDQALREQANVDLGPLGWDPIRPRLGPGDPLAQVRWQSDLAGNGRNDTRVSSLFAAGRLRVPQDPEARAEVVEALLGALSSPERQKMQPGLRALLLEERRRIARMRSLEAAQDVDAATRGLRRRLYPYQRDGVQAMLHRGRLLLGDDMGLGKTTQAIASAHALFRAKKVKRGLVITPASLKSQWLREWRATTDVPAAVVEGSRADREATYRAHNSGFLVLNYEVLLRDFKAIVALKPEMVVLDEAQRIKNWATKTAAYVKALTPEYRLVLTGTPMENRLDELASLFDWVDDRALEPKWRLAPLHTVWERTGEGRGRAVGARHLDTLRERMKGSFLRRVRADVLSQLPPRTDVRVPVELTDRQARAHAELDEPIAQLASRARKRPLSQKEFLRLMSLLTTQRMICNGMAVLEFAEVWPTLDARAPYSERQIGRLASPKLAEFRALIEELVVEQGRKVVIFSQWRRMLQLARWAIDDVLAKAGLRTAFFTGAESQARRTSNVVAFHDEPDLRVMFLTDAGGVGLNLQRAATACINLELPWNPAVLEQRIGRIHRLGQTSPIDVYNLVSEGGIESRIATLVGAKRALFEGLFDGESNEVRFEDADTVMTKLERLIEPASAPDLPPAEPSEDEAAPEPIGEVEDLGQSAGDAEPVSKAPTAQAVLPTQEALQALVSALRVEAKPDGSLTIEAPPEAARTLASLFDSMASALRAGAEAPPEG